MLFSALSSASSSFLAGGMLSGTVWVDTAERSSVGRSESTAQQTTTNLTVANGTSFMNVSLSERSSVMRTESTAQQTSTKLTAANIKWLHIPKCGTSFMNVLLSWACPRMKETAMVGTKKPMKKRPKRILNVASFVKDHQLQCLPGFHICGGHQGLFKGSCNDWHAHFGHFVAVFRQPEDRVISEANGFGNKEARRIGVLAFARKTRGKSVQMMTGDHHHYNHSLLNQERVQEAIFRLDHGFAFVGILEEYHLSICLFHAMFGGDCHEREFHNTRPRKKRKHSVPFNKTELKGWTDPLDGPFYKHARRIFWNNAIKYNVSLETCRTTVCPAFSDKFV